MILVITPDHVDKIVIYPGKCTFIKDIDTTLPRWLVVAVSRSELAEPGLVVEIIRN